MNVLEARRRLLGAGVYKKTVTGNPAIAQGSLARMYPGIEMQGWTEQDSTTGAQLFNKNTVDKNKYIADTNGNVYEGVVDKETSASDYVLVSGLDYICATITSFRQWMAFYDAEKTYISGKNGYSKPIPVPENAAYARFTISNDYIDSFMVNAGQTSLPWEPYTGGAPSPSPDYPQEIVSAGNWNEENHTWEYEIEVGGNDGSSQTLTLTADRPLTKWDKLTKKNGVWGWEYGSAEIVFDGSDDEYWNEYPSRNGFNTVISRMLRGVALDGFCDKLIISKVDVIDYPTAVLGSNNNDIYVKQVSSYASDVNGWKTWLQSNPITVLYQLAEPVFVPLSETEQEQMNALHTNRPTTVLSNDCECSMSLTYKTKKSMGGGVIS